MSAAEPRTFSLPPNDAVAREAVEREQTRSLR